MKNAKIIDVHIHCSNLSEDLLNSFAKINGLRYTLSELLDEMKRNGVHKGLLLSPPLEGNYPLLNEKVLELTDKSNGLLKPVFTVEPSREHVKDSIALARKNKDLLKGFKIRLGYLEVYAYDQVFDSLYDYAESEDLPVMFHTGDTASSTGSLLHSHPLTLDRLANKREKLKIVACHFGNPWIEDVAELIYKHFNVYADISGLFTGTTRYAEQFKKVLAQRISHAIYFADGAEKIMFGTDYPVETISSGISFAKSLSIREDDLQKIMHDNAKKVFRLH